MNCIDEGINLLEVLWTYIITMQKMYFLFTQVLEATERS